MLTTNEFINALADSNLLSADLLVRIRKRVSDSGGKFDPRAIAKYLIDKEYLTLWQANQLLAGRRAFFLGRYKLLDRIGKGGMGVVFKAQHAVMDRVVALKVMSRALLNNSQAVARFNREVRTAAALNHPNIISAYDADCVGNTHFLVMEYVDGRDLNAWLKARGVFPIAGAIDCALQTAQGLSYAHRQGMVHRDIKPVNLLVRWDTEHDRPIIKILDLGLARFVSETQEEGGLTRMGQTIGTPDYIAPEAAESFKDADIRADIFSLGCTLFKLLTGRLPFGGENTMEKLVARTTRDAPGVRTLRPECPAELEAVVAKMLARNPDERYQTPAELIAALQPLEKGLPDATEQLTFFREPLAAHGQLATNDIQPDADTSLADFFRDFSVSPLRDEKPAAPRSEIMDDGLELLPIDDDDKTRAEPSAAPVASSQTANEKSKSKNKSTKPRLVEPLPEDDVGDPPGDPLDEALGAPPKSGKSSGNAARERAFREMSGAAPSRARRNAWDSPLLLIGGGSLLLLMIVGAALYYSVNRRTGDELLKTASDAYKNGAYQQSARDYSKFLEEFPDHKEASQARVFRGLAQMRQAIGQGGDWSAALATTKQALSDISGETRFGEARPELASILPTLAEGIAQQASRNKDAKLVEAGHEALALSDKYVPSEIRQGQRIQAVIHSLELTAREIARTGALETTVAEMQKAAAEGRTAEGYALRKELLKTYPDLATQQSLTDAVMAVAAAEQTAVVVDATGHAAISGEPESPVASAVTLAAPQGKPAPGVRDQVIVAQLGQSAYGIDATEGSLLWRRNVGAGVGARPIPLSAQPGADWLLFDSQQNELWRVDAKTGNVRWRQVAGDVLAGDPVSAEGTIWASTQSGKLLAIDAEHGGIRLTVQLPQPVSSGPVVVSRAKKLYQAGLHSSLFALSTETGQCEQVIYLGHEAGTVATAPLAVTRYLFVAENHLLDNAQLRVLLADQQGGNLQQVARLPLEGHVHAAPQMLDRSLFVVTDLGAVYAFGVNAPGEKEPLSRQAQAPAIGKQHLPRLFVAKAARLWVASDELNRYDVQLAQGRLAPAAQRYQGDQFQQPLTALGDVLFTTRRKQGTAAVTVAALNLQTGDVYWESDLAAPAAALVPHGDALYAVSADGVLYRVDEQLAAPRAVAGPIARAKGSNTLQGTSTLHPIDAQQVLVASRGESPAALLVDWKSDSAPTVAWLPSAGWGAAPAVLAGSVVAATREGPVSPVSAIAAAPAIQPWEPQRGLHSTPRWRDLATYRDQALLLAEGAAQLFLLTIDEQPLRRLSAKSQSQLDQPIGSAPAVAGDMAYLLTDKQQVLGVHLPDLKPDAPWAMPARQVWGPVSTGASVYLATVDGQLFRFAGKPTPEWSSRLDSPLGIVGLAEDEVSLVVATADGGLAMFDKASGKSMAQVQTAERLMGNPLLHGGQVLVGTSDGSVLAVAVPTP